jgi:hypothetical protein
MRGVQSQNAQAQTTQARARAQSQSSTDRDNVFGSGLNNRSSAPRSIQPTAPPLFSAPHRPTRPLQSPQAPQTARASQAVQSGIVLPAMAAAYQYCPRCGTGLGRSINFCPVRRKDTVSCMLQFDWPLARFSLSIGAVMVGGFLMGVVWCSFLVNYLGRSNDVGRPTSLPSTVVHQPKPTEYSLKMTAQTLPR